MLVRIFIKLLLRKKKNMNEDSHFKKPKSETESYKKQRRQTHMDAYVSTEPRLVLESVVLKEKKDRGMYERFG